MCNLSINTNGPVMPESGTVQCSGLAAEFNNSALLREGGRYSVTSGLNGLRSGSEPKIILFSTGQLFLDKRPKAVKFIELSL